MTTVRGLLSGTGAQGCPGLRARRGSAAEVSLNPTESLQSADVSQHGPFGSEYPARVSLECYGDRAHRGDFYSLRCMRAPAISGRLQASVGLLPRAHIQISLSRLR